MPPESGTQRALGQHDAKIEMLHEDVRSIDGKFDKLEAKLDGLCIHSSPCKELENDRAELRGAMGAVYVIAGSISVVVGIVMKAIA